MIYTFLQFAPLLDFSALEIAIQNFFCDATQGGGLFTAPPANATANAENWQPPAGKAAFFTGFQAQTFTKARPRIDLGPVSHTEIQQTRVIDVNGRLWRNAWNVPLEFFVITKADYSTHTSMLAKVRAIIQFMNPISTAIQTSGLNAFMTLHELAQIKDAGGQIAGGRLQGEEGYFGTPLKYNAIFAVAAASWPGGILNA